VQGILGPAHFARLEGAALQDPLILDAAPLAPGPNGDPLGANHLPVWPPHVDVIQRLPGPVGRHPQAERQAPRSVQLFFGVNNLPFGGFDTFCAVAPNLFDPSFNFIISPRFQLLDYRVFVPDYLLQLSLHGAGEAS
jgi:hypothetical protein